MTPRFPLFLCLVIALGGLATPAQAFIDLAPSLGKLANDSNHIVVLEVEKVSQEKRAIIFKKVADLKGKRDGGEIKLRLANGWTPRNAKIMMELAAPGNTAVFFINGTVGYLCIGSYWCLCSQESPPWWVTQSGAPECGWTYAGSVEKLRKHLTMMLAGQEVVIPVRKHLTKELAPGGDMRNLVFAKGVLHEREFPIMRVQASLKMPLYAYQAKAVGLGAVGPEEVPALIDALKGGNATARAEAADDLASLGPQAKAAVPALSQALNDPDALVRVRAAKALAKAKPEDPAPVPALIDQLKSKDATIRRAAAGALGEIGPSAKAAAPVLTESLQHADASVRHAAALALAYLGPEAKRAVPALVEALKDQDEDVRFAAAEALGEIGEKNEVVVGALLKGIQDKDPAAQRSAALALVRLNTQVDAAAGVFIERLKGYIPSEISILISIGPDALPALRQGLRHADGEIRMNVCHVLRYINWAKVGPAALDEMIKPIAAALKDPDERVRVTAAEALDALGPRAKAAVPALVEALEDKAGNVRVAAALALGAIGPEARAAIPALTEMTKDKDAKASKAAADALKKIQPK
jgi:HEAT repeat protein